MARHGGRMSLKDLAKRVDVNRETLARLERGDLATSLGVLARVLRVLGLEEDLDLLDGDDELGQRLQDIRLPRPRCSPKRVGQMNGGRDQVASISTRRVGPRPAGGDADRESSGSQAVISFAYAPGWVVDRAAFQSTRACPLRREQYPSALPGVFSDSAPDRWGETL